MNDAPLDGWANWAGNVTAPGVEVLRPHDADELRAALQRAARDRSVVRVAGRGHSFSPLVHSPQLIVDLAAFTGVSDVEPGVGGGGRAWVGAGTPIFALGSALWAHGLSLHNQGDIDTQSIGGAVATGTHGTGPTLGCLSSAVDGVRLMTADGEQWECDADHHGELFAASRLGLGATGVVTALRIRLAPAYHLHERTWLEPTATCLERLDERVGATRHFEFFWLPDSDRCFAKSLAPQPAAPADTAPDRAPEPASAAADGPTRLVSDRVDRAYRVFPSVRSERFVEMEFAVPAGAGPVCFAELRELYQRHHPEVTWPIEYRTLAGDDTWVGPASERDSVTLSVHQSVALDHRPLFNDAEAIFRAHGGRPHWGKLHRFDGEDLARAYPHWERFWAVADQVDPNGRFRNDHLRHLRP
ncbi:MAG: D-arabinono-1,4-lactone oxidase [Acidimicrobiales bacterium]